MSESFESFKKSGVPEKPFTEKDIFDAEAEAVIVGHHTRYPLFQEPKRQLQSMELAESYDSEQRELLAKLLRNQSKDFFYEGRKIKSIDLLCRDLRVVLTEAGLPAEMIHTIFYDELRSHVNRLSNLEKDSRPSATQAQEEMQLRQRIVSTVAARYFSTLNPPLQADGSNDTEALVAKRPPYRDSDHEYAEDQQRLQTTTHEDQAAFVRENQKTEAQTAVGGSFSNPEISAVENFAGEVRETATLVAEAQGVLVQVVEQVPYYREQLRYAADGATSEMTDARRAALYAANNILLRGGQLRKRLAELQMPGVPVRLLAARIQNDIMFIERQKGTIEGALAGLRGEPVVPKFAKEKPDGASAAPEDQEVVVANDEKSKKRFRIGWLASKETNGTLTEAEKTELEALTSDDSLWDTQSISSALRTSETAAENAVLNEVDTSKMIEPVVTEVPAFTYTEPDPALFERRDWQTIAPIESVAGAVVPNGETIATQPLREVSTEALLGQEQREASLQDSDAAWLRAAPEQVVQLADKMVAAEAAIKEILETIHPVIVDAGYYRRDTAGNEQSMALADVRNKLQSLQNRLRIMQGGVAGEARAEEVDALSTEVALYRQTAEKLVAELAGTHQESEATDTVAEANSKQLLGLSVPNEQSGPFTVRAFRDALNIEWQPVKRAAEARNDRTTNSLKAAFQEIFSLLGYVPDTGITKVQAERLAALAGQIGQPARIVGDFVPEVTTAPEPATPTQSSAESIREGVTGEVLGDAAVVPPTIDVTPVQEAGAKEMPAGGQPEVAPSTPLESVLKEREATQASKLGRLPAFLEKLKDPRGRKYWYGLGFSALTGALTGLTIVAADGSKKQGPSFESAVGTNIASAPEVTPSRPLTIDGVAVTTEPLNPMRASEAAKVSESPYTFIGARNAAGEVINTVSEASVEFWKQHPDVLGGVTLSKNGFLRAMYAVFDRAEKDPSFRRELTDAMKITSGDLDLVYEQVSGDAGRSTIDLQPLFNAISEAA